MSNVCLQDPQRAPKGVKMAHSRRYVRRVDDADVWQELKYFATAFNAYTDAYPMPDQKDLGMRCPYTPISHTDLSRVQRHIAPSHPLGRYRGPLWIGGQKRSTASSKVEPSLSRLDPRRRQLSCFAVQRSYLPLFESLPALAFGGSVVFGQVNDYYVSYRAVRRPAYGHRSPCSAPWTRLIWRAFFPRSNKMDWRMQARRFGSTSNCVSTAKIHAVFFCLRFCWRRPCCHSPSSAWSCVVNVQN